MTHPDETTEFFPHGLTAPLLAWYRANARPLPWRETDDPYPIWVSEIMLQQTRVAAVLGYYARFLEAFPSVEALADAAEERLLKCWEGLGYYSRARNLQRAARQIAAQGRFPDTYEGLLALPGVGDYTAAAVASAAFGLPYPAVDGNVLRVTSRLADSAADVALPVTKRRVRAALAEAMPCAPAEIRLFNQAVMELGATVCVPNGPPRCSVCPAADLCLARKRGTAADRPVKGAKKPRRREEKTVFLLLREGRAALSKRPDAGLLARLWEFPNVPGVLTAEEAAHCLAGWGLTAAGWEMRLTARHIFTHVEWDMTGYVLSVTGEGPAHLAWVDLAGLERLALPSAFSAFTAEAKRRLE